MRSIFSVLLIALAVSSLLLQQASSHKGIWSRSGFKHHNSHSQERLFSTRGGAAKGKKASSSKGSSKKSKKPAVAGKGQKEAEDDEEDTPAPVPTAPAAAATASKTEKTDFAEAILKKKDSPNMLLVDDSVDDDHSTISVSPAKLEALGLLSGDTVQLYGKKRKTTVAVIASDENVVDSKVRMTKVVRSNLRCDIVYICL